MKWGTLHQLGLPYPKLRSERLSISLVFPVFMSSHWNHLSIMCQGSSEDKCVRWHIISFCILYLWSLKDQEWLGTIRDMRRLLISMTTSPSTMWAIGWCYCKSIMFNKGLPGVPPLQLSNYILKCMSTHLLHACTWYKYSNCTELWSFISLRT
jgi:hypothetical protein